MDAKNRDAEDHTRTVIHLDIDCFYAQVEMIKDPSLANKPLGVQQKSIVVTSNYIARRHGVKKLMSVAEAQRLCPDLVLVKGEDLHDYRQISYDVTTYLQRYSLLVERLGLDENYVDVTNLVEMKERNEFDDDISVIGHVFGDTAEEQCQCGCYKRLAIGSVIAQEIREAIKDNFKLTCCAGVSHNKLLAKLAGATHKPDQQTVVFPNSAYGLLCGLSNISGIPGIGRTTLDALHNMTIKTIDDLQNCDGAKLRSVFGEERAKLLRNLSCGIDPSPVKSSGKPLSIGLEDSCKPISILGKVKEKLNQLLKRLMVLLSEDKRLPRTIKLTVRKFDKNTKTSHRETKQCNISPSLFTMRVSIELSEQSEHKLMAIIMSLFNKIVDIDRPYHVTLLGLSFTKFIERMNGKSSITAFFAKKNVEVQSVTNIENKSDAHLLMDCSSCPPHEFNTDGSESEFEPSPKKSKLTALIAKRHCFDMDDCPSPSKLKVADLHLYSKDPEEADKQEVSCPPDADVEVFKELPRDLQQELWENYKREVDRSHRLHSELKKPKVNTLLHYFVKN